MQQPEPMPHLMHRRLPQLVPPDPQARRRPRHTPRQDITPVGRVVHSRVLDLRRHRAIAARHRIRDRGRERAVAQQCRRTRSRGSIRIRRRRQVRLEVEIQRRVRPPPQRLLHRRGISVGGPGVVDGPGSSGETERDERGAVQGVEDGHLAADHGVADGGGVRGALVGCGDEVDVCGYDDAGAGAGDGAGASFLVVVAAAQLLLPP